MTLRYRCQCNCGQITHCYKRILPNWAMFDGTNPPYEKTLIQDVDGRSHQCGKFLILEGKSPGDELSGPTLRSFASDAAHGNSSLAFWCSDPMGGDIQRYYSVNIPGFKDGEHSGTLIDVRAARLAWWESVRVNGKW